MKNTLTTLALTVAMMSPAFAQSVIAHINVDSMLVEMPEYQAVMATLQADQARFESEAKEMNAELERGAQVLQANAGTWTELRQRQDQQRLQDMYNTIQEYLKTAQQTLQSKEMELVTPVYEKLQAAINEAAKESKANYVLDASKSMIIFASGGLNLTTAVKAKLSM
jgi:outer membrane protein